MVAVLGRKGMMTQLYDEQGTCVPVTAIRMDECVVIATRTVKKNGYEALQLGFGRANPKRLTKPMAGHFRQAGVEPARLVREVRMDTTEGFKPGQQLGPDLFQPGDKVWVEGRTKGRGFAGGMKRWGWHGGNRTHGATSHRRVGSVGAGTSPGRVLPGRTLPGHYGTERVSIKNLRVVKIEPEKGILYVNGAVPGHRDGVVLVKRDS